MSNNFLKDIDEGSIHFRDSLQFELKSEFTFNPKMDQNTFIQEFYLFIPETLQINEQTYKREQFYLDQTNLIRYKTPDFTFEEMIDPQNEKSPLIKILNYNNQLWENNNQEKIIYEIKLFGNIFRSSLRVYISSIISKLNEEPTPLNREAVALEITQFCAKLEKLRAKYFAVQQEIQRSRHNTTMLQNFNYVDEFLCDTIEYYLTGLLDALRKSRYAGLSGSDDLISKILSDEKKYRDIHHLLPEHYSDPEAMSEAVLYRQGILQKFMLEVLLLKSNRIEVLKKQGPLLGAIAAGIAMLFYMVLFVFVWKNPRVVINSIPFVLSVVFFYILKDRIKEGLKQYYQQNAIKWFPDYRTTIYGQTSKPIGELSESFSFIDKSKVPAKILEARNIGFHDDLETLQRHETIIQYKREVRLYGQSEYESFRRNEITTLFRYSIQRYIQKANDPIEEKLILSPETQDLIVEQLPKVYHLNIVIKNTHTDPGGTVITDLKKYRVILNKQGIKRVERVP